MGAQSVAGLAMLVTGGGSGIGRAAAAAALAGLGLLDRTATGG